MSKRREVWSLVDHACRECGGRILRSEFSVITGGGNPIWRCADCGVSTAAMTASALCWCGFTHRGQGGAAYSCVAVSRAKEEPAIEAALLRAGYLAPNPRDRPKQEVAVVSEDTLRWAAKHIEEADHA